MNALVKSCKAIRNLGFTKLWYYFLYQLGLRSGHYQRLTPNRRSDYQGQPELSPIQSFPILPQPQQEQAIKEAEEVRKGLIRLFDGQPVPLDLTLGASEAHWTALANSPPEGDIKFIWEPARFGWAITLARAFALSQDPIYAQDFWDRCLDFLRIHPPNLGRQWQSAQEVAMRLMVLIFCDRVFDKAPSSTAEKRRSLWQAIAEHAQRIPPTLVYARAQNNNHLLAEAAGLYAAGVYLANHPQAQKWHQLGWRWLNWGFQHQIDAFGTYIQHSTNYHRLMLQLALYTDQLRRLAGDPDWPAETMERLQATTRWLWALTDPDTGEVPNLGASDSAYLLPLTCAPHQDYRPVIQAAAHAFLKGEIYHKQALTEMSQWFDLTPHPTLAQTQPQAIDMLQIGGAYGRAFIHTAHYSDRPSHADQLHVDLWWRGVNVAMDPGTYQYNGSRPWDNALATARVHNTLTLDGHDQMTRAGRFLWLDWAQATILSHEIDDQGNLICVTAEHNGYQRLGALHQRRVKVLKDGWEIVDGVLPYGNPDSKDHTVHLTWLLPDWAWTFSTENTLHLAGPEFTCGIKLEGMDEIQLFRAGECIYGSWGLEPTWGWSSPRYGLKTPALLVLAIQKGQLPLTLRSAFNFKP
jgi:hypothetical protein